MNFLKFTLGSIVIGGLISSHLQAAEPVANDDQFTIGRAATIDITANDHDDNGDPFWVTNIDKGSCPAEITITPMFDGMVEVALPLPLIDSCQFTYELTALKITAGEGNEQDAIEHSLGVAVVTLTAQEGDKSSNWTWSGSSGGQYNQSNQVLLLGDLELGAPARIESFTVKNNFGEGTGEILQIDLDLDLNDPNLSLVSHGFDDGDDYTIALNPQETVSFEMKIDPSVAGEILGELQVSARIDDLQSQRYLGISGEVIDTCVQQPFAVHSLPGDIQAEAFDYCGYFDLTPGNQAGGVLFRPDEDVDVRAFHSRTAVTQTEAGEWVEYGIEASETGVYSVHVWYSHPESAGNFTDAVKLVINYTNPEVPASEHTVELMKKPGGPYNFYRGVLRNVLIESAVKSLKFQIEGNGGYNLDYFSFNKTHALNDLAQPFPDTLVALGSESELIISPQFLLANDDYNPYLLDPWSYHYPEIILVNVNPDNPVATWHYDPESNQSSIRIDTSGFTQTGTHQNIFSYRLKQGEYTSEAVGLSLEIDPNAQLVVANDDVLDLGTSEEFTGIESYNIGYLLLQDNDSVLNSTIRFERIEQPSCAGLDNCQGTTNTGQSPAGFLYTPDPRVRVQGGMDSIDYTIRASHDNSPQTETDDATVVIHFYAPPVANDDFADQPMLAYTDAGLWITEAELLQNDEFNYNPTRLMHDELDVPSGMNVVYDAQNQGFNVSFAAPGRYQLKYRLEDNLRQKSNWGIVHIDAYNEAPVANFDALFVEYPLQGGTQTVTHFIDVLANDTDQNGDPLSITGIDSENTHGQVEMASSGQGVIYTPPAEVTNDLDYFNYTVSDGYSAVTAQVRVMLIPTFPNATNDVVPVTTSPFTSTDILIADLMATDSGSYIVIDPEGFDFSNVIGTLVIGGDIASGQLPEVLRYTPPATGFVPSSFTYRIMDRYGQVSEPATVSLVAN